MESKLLLVRHAITSWHGQSRVLGQNDIPLDEEGISQALGLSEALKSVNVGRIVTSPLQRARRTAELVAQPHGAGVQADDRLTDFRVGEWEGLTYAELAQRADYKRFLADPLGTAIPGGEALGQARERAVAAATDTMRDAAGKCIVFVTHSDIVRLLLCHYFGLGLEQYTCLRVSVASVSVLSISDRKVKLLTLNWRPTLVESAFPSVT
jgi:broad specificity phosphatase PhoE